MKRFLPVVTGCLIAGIMFILLQPYMVKAESPQNGALVEAANVGNLVEVNRLLALGADPNSRRKESSELPWWKQALHPMEVGLPALTLAANRASADIVEELLTHGADPNIRDNLGSTPLMWAASHRQASAAHFETIRSLLRHGADVNAANERGMTALMYAAMTAPPDVAKQLLDNGTNAKNRDSSGHTAFYWAKLWKNTRAIPVLQSAGLTE